jgi:GTP-binding protein
MHELSSFSPMLAEKPMIVIATKLDATTDTSHLDELRAFAIERGLPFHAISSATGEGIKELVRAMADALDRIPKPVVPASENDNAVEYRELSRAAHYEEDDELDHVTPDRTPPRGDED